MVRVSRAGDPVEDLLSATFKITQHERGGTCFLLSEGKPESRHVILATAAHVLDEMPEEDCELVLRSGNAEQGFQRFPFSLEIRHRGRPYWKRHPDVDVAAMRVELPEGATVKPIAIEQLANEAQLIDRSVHVGQETWIGCFPAKLEANDAGWPVLRRGSIATFPLTPVKTAKTILIDYKVFGGDSGAPVAVIHEGKLLIVGVASSMHRQTDKMTMQLEERTVHTPLGLSISVQATYLRETIDLLLAK